MGSHAFTVTYIVSIFLPPVDAYVDAGHTPACTENCIVVYTFTLFTYHQLKFRHT
jgi:uncharacterized membrane protein YqaE (UPF0057 family)